MNDIEFEFDNEHIDNVLQACEAFRAKKINADQLKQVLYYAETGTESFEDQELRKLFGESESEIDLMQYTELPKDIPGKILELIAKIEKKLKDRPGH